MPDRVIVEIDSRTSENRTGIVRRFSPYYNGKTSKVKEQKKEEIQILISTDVLAEGLNLQDSFDSSIMISIGILYD